MDRFTVFLENFHEEGVETGALPCRSEELDDGAGRRDGPGGDELSCTDGEERRMVAMVTTSSSQVHGDGVDVYEKGLDCGQGADGSGSLNADTIGVHEGPSMGSIEGEAVEVNSIRALDHVVGRK